MLDTSSSEESKEESKDKKEDKSDSSSSSELTEDELSAIEKELSKMVTTEQKSHAMRILRAFGKGAGEGAQEAAMVSSKLYTSIVETQKKVYIF